MAVAIPTTIPPAALASRRRISVITNPDPRDPDALAAAVCGIRYYEIRRTAEGVGAAYHLRDGIWLDLHRAGTFDSAVAAVAQHIDLVWDVFPDAGSIDAERQAAATVRVGVADDVALPLAA